MSVGKYSPTVSYSYSRDQSWWERNGGGYGNGKNPECDNDDDGFDRYGYSGEVGTGPDRAGHDENEYLDARGWCDMEGDYHYEYELYDDISSEWGRRLIGDPDSYPAKRPFSGF